MKRIQSINRVLLAVSWGAVALLLLLQSAASAVPVLAAASLGLCFAELFAVPALALCGCTVSILWAVRQSDSRAYLTALAHLLVLLPWWYAVSSVIRAA